MLRQRVITAVLLLAVLLPCLFAPVTLPFALFTLLAIAAAGWEWARLNPLAAAMAQRPVAAWASGALLGGLCLLWLARWPMPPRAALAGGTDPRLWQAGLLLWVVGLVIALRAGPTGWPRLPTALRWLLGLSLLGLAWLALVQARGIGVNFLLSVMAVVWTADIAAYFSGRAFGRRKLAPQISPGKSWEGVYGGVLGVAVLACVWLLLIDPRLPVDSPSLFRLLLQRGGAGLLLVGVLLLTALGVCGDLFESLVKRSAGVKDSSQLLPGHGGVLDRVDALLPVLPAALALISW
ncbi:MAG: hypothetical protein RLY78_4208 [Pseudomonadota bacterium]|jgi:phosphatidate cytidylyltransferase|uniref:Phosphatidate cytidylyltransferase n=1 Tax=Pseudaquabacterium rugosum TaxID=2984194 RepID=A0ABU9BBM2_9BURK